MLVFLWVLAALGIGYAAKLQGRRPFHWFVLSVFASPLVGSVILWWFNKAYPV